MSRRCSSCGALVESNMRVCPNCGRLLASIGDRHEYQPENSRKAVHASGKTSGNARRRPAERTAPHRQAQQGADKRPRKGEAADTNIKKKRPAPEKPAPRPAERKRPPEEQETREMPGWTKIVKRAVIAAVIIVLAYFALFGLQVLRVRKASYKFDTSMTLSASNYGEAFDNSVTDGSWSYNPFTFTVTYKGIHDNKDIAVRFTAGWDLEVKSITVGEEEKTSKEQINIYLMGLYI